MSNFLACRHLTRLDQAAAHDLVKKPHLRDVGFDALVRRGEEHEARVLADFRGRGWVIEEITDPFQDPERAAEQTRGALARGLDVIYQAALLLKDRLGYPDFLVRADLLGEGNGYEVIDAKLARSAKARAVLQATFYSRLLAETIGIGPKRLHLALGQGELASFDLPDFTAYERQVDRLLVRFTEGEAHHPSVDTYPDPVEHCAVCRWRVDCMTRRRKDDDLSLIAGITSRQRKALRSQGIGTRRAFATPTAPPTLSGVGRESMAKVHAQARIQVEGEDSGEPRWELVEPEREEGELVPHRGLLVLPEPAEGDLFFDIEGSRYYSEDAKEFGLQYLFGIVNTADVGEENHPRYRAYWAFDRAGERRTFEELMDFLAEHLERYRDAHIYHYNHYEPTALDHLSELHVTREEVLRRLMGRFATREDELDQLLRRRIFVDLYRVVRQGVRASVESYSLKRLEPFCGFERAVELTEVNERMVAFDVALDEGTARGDFSTQELIEGYNEDDCRATLALRDWLEARRTDLEAQLGVRLPRPAPPEVPEDTTSPEVKELRSALLEGLSGAREEWTDEQRARALVADLLEYHRREEKPGWWRFFYLCGLTDEELLDEPDAIAGLRLQGQVRVIRKSVLFKYTFPPQEHGFSDEKDGVDPITGRKWDLVEVDDAAGFLLIRRGPSMMEHRHPTALIEPGPEFRTTTHRESLRALARRVIEAGGSGWLRDPALDLLLRRRPNADGESGGPLTREGETGLAAARRLAVALDRSCLPVQGPPGTGKTYTGANQVLDLVAKGRRVGVTAVSHAVIQNLLNEVAKVARQRGASARIGQRCDEERWVSPAAAEADLVFGSAKGALDALNEGALDVLGGTTWVWTREDFEGALDVLVVDEAGQMSIADVLASSRSAKNLILLGDPLQLAHPSQGAHPPGSAVSALEHILDGAATMPNDLGLFIPLTRRMHPDITRFTSEVFYDGRLSGIEGLDRQAVLCDGLFVGSGLRVVEVLHEGNSNSSPEEAAEVVAILRELTRCRWRDSEGTEHGVDTKDVMIVTPFNAQIREIKDALDEAGLGEVNVGTVDKFQGRQAPVVVYSMASSSPEDAPRGLEFLYDLHRLNVATSRAQCLAIVVRSPDLVRVFAKTPRQMELANALCRLRELSP